MVRNCAPENLEIPGLVLRTRVVSPFRPWEKGKPIEFD
jgi:hypothetical protein